MGVTGTRQLESEDPLWRDRFLPFLECQAFQGQNKDTYLILMWRFWLIYGDIFYFGHRKGLCDWRKFACTENNASYSGCSVLMGYQSNIAVLCIIFLLQKVKKNHISVQACLGFDHLQHQTQPRCHFLQMWKLLKIPRRNLYSWKKLLICNLLGFEQHRWQLLKFLLGTT